MNWALIISGLLLSLSGFTAAVYSTVAERNGWAIGNYYKRNGVLSIIGGITVFGVIPLLFFLGEEGWSIASLFLSWFLSQVLIQTLGYRTQIIVPFLFVGSLASLILLLFRS